MKTIRWVGHPSPFEDKNIERLLVAEAIPMPMVKAFRLFENRRVSAVPGRAEFSVGPAHGFSRTYRWLPQQELEMEDKDVELLFRHLMDRSMFLDVTDVSIPLGTRPSLTRRQWAELIDAALTAPDPVMVRIG